jgi:chemotaxis receptor (MCP) glutamine deamidase CheD
MLVDENYNIKIGELKIIKRADEVVWTILGSCVSVVFHVRPDLGLNMSCSIPSSETLQKQVFRFLSSPLLYRAKRKGEI